MFKYIIAISFLSITIISNAADTELIKSTTERNLLSKEMKGIKAHKKGNYKKAYKYLYDTAIWGRKDAQYFLSLMYLKGQYVKQDIIKGMALLAVANEAKIMERRELYTTIYNALTEPQKSQVDEKAAEYISKFGMKAKGMVCSETQDLGSRNKVINCHTLKSRIGGSFVID